MAEKLLKQGASNELIDFVYEIKVENGKPKNILKIRLKNKN